MKFRQSGDHSNGGVPHWNAHQLRAIVPAPPSPSAAGASEAAPQQTPPGHGWATPLGQSRGVASAEIARACHPSRRLAATSCGSPRLAAICLCRRHRRLAARTSAGSGLICSAPAGAGVARSSQRGVARRSAPQRYLDRHSLSPTTRLQGLPRSPACGLRGLAPLWKPRARGLARGRIALGA
jgi:hypothetical protein